MMTETIPITAVVLTRNEADNIGRCLSSLQRCQDILIVDDNSDDDTVHIAKQHKARVMSHRFESFAAQRNLSFIKVAALHEKTSIAI